MAVHSSKKLVRSKSGLRIVSSNDNHRSPFELSEPPWIPDNECKTCTECQTRFDFIKRRHHCRRCGKIYCRSCCDAWLALPRMCFVDPVRLCDLCAEKTRRENEFYEKHLKTLTSGAMFYLNSSYLDNMNESSSFACKLSQDHRVLLFDNGNGGTHEPIELIKILSLNIVKTPDDIQGASEMKLRYNRGSSMDEEELKLTACSDPHRRQAMIWIAAMQKAMKMMYEAQHPDLEKV